MELPAMLADILDDLQQPNVFWQVACLAVSLALAGWLAYALRSRVRGAQEGNWRVGRRGVARLLFPAFALAFVLTLRPLLRPYMHVNLFNLAVPLLVSLGMIRLVVYILRQAFAPSGWLAVSERFIALVVWGAVALNIVGLDDGVIDLMEQVSFKVGRQELNLWMLLHGLVTIFVTVLAALWLGGLVEGRLMRTEQLDSSLRVVLARVVKALLTLVAVLISLSLVGIDITTLSVFGGALGVGLGFGLQKIASNYVSGFIILLDRSIRLGNLITLDAGTTGVVTQITTRYTVLRALSGIEHIIPNEFFVANVVQNQSFTDTRVFIKTAVQVGYGSDMEQVLGVLVELAKAHPRVLQDPPPRAYLVNFADSGVDMEVGFWINDPDQGTGNIRSDINLSIWKRFKELGIEIPFPQREVRLLGSAQVQLAGASGAESSAG